VWSGLSFAVPYGLGARGVELGIFCVFLTTVSLHRRIDALLGEHRALIFERHQRPRRAHALTASSVLASFLGVCVAYAVLVDVVEPDRAAHTFGFALAAADVGSQGLLSRSFGELTWTVTNNLGVMVGVLCLGVVFRSYGAVLVLVWNACIWVVALTTLTARSAEAAEVGALWFRVIAAAALLPHLVLELSGYVLAALAGIFVSRGIFRYGWSDPVLEDILGSSAALVMGAAVVLVLAAVVEATVPGLVLGLAGR